MKALGGFVRPTERWLISEAAEAGHGSGGIFSNLLPKIERGRDDVIHATEEAVPDIPHFVITEPDEIAAPETEDIRGDFFEFEDIEPDAEFDFVESSPRPDEPVETKPETRKIKPYEIPAGHVDLGDAGRTTIRGISKSMIPSALSAERSKAVIT